MGEFVLISYAPGYEINRDGVVRSLPRTVVRRRGTYVEHIVHIPGKVLKPWLSHEYPTVSLRVRGKTITRKVCKIVMDVFGPPQPIGKPCVCHCNGNSHDSSLDNLVWGSHKDNMADARRHGTLAKGERQGQAKLTADIVNEIRHLREAGMTYRMIGERFGVCRHHVSHIVRRMRWEHIL